MSDKQPNIVLIMSDDLGYEVIGANGGTSYATPRLDEIAQEGMRFEEAHVMPLCTPTRLSLMTGKYNFRNYIGFGLIKPDEVTFGHLFSDAGYNTCISGKWQLYSYNPPDEAPEMRSKGQRMEDAGFDEYCVWHAHHTEEKGSRYKSPIIYENGEFRDDTEGKYGEDVFCDYIIDYIERKKDDDRPFFVYWPMAATHKPHEPTPDSPEWDSFDPPSNRTLGGRTWAEIEDASWDDDPRFYKDMVEYHDKVIGRLMDYLDEQGLGEDTLVIYVGTTAVPMTCARWYTSTTRSRRQGQDERPWDARPAHLPYAGDDSSGVREQRPGGVHRLSADRPGGGRAGISGGVRGRWPIVLSAAHRRIWQPEGVGFLPLRADERARQERQNPLRSRLQLEAVRDRRAVRPEDGPRRRSADLRGAGERRAVRGRRAGCDRCLSS